MSVMRGSHQPEAGQMDATGNDKAGVFAEMSDPQTRGSIRQIRRRPQLSVDARTRSDFGTVSHSFKIGTIMEEKQQTPDDYFTVKNTTLFAASDRHAQSDRSQSEHFATRSSSDNAESPFTIPSSTRDAASHLPDARPETPVAKGSSDQRPSLSWMRTLSGGIFLDRSSSGRDGSSSLQNPSPSHRSTPSAIKPLRPPTLPRLSNMTSSSEHQIRVETPFSLPKGTEAENEDTEKKERFARRSLLGPRELFPSYINLVRKIAKSRPVREPATLFSARNRAVPKNHRSGWRRDHISPALYRVSSLLTDLRSLRSKEKLRSSRSADSVSLRSVKIRKQPLPMERVSSMEFVAESESESSSLVRLRMGTQPPNTPSEQATYRAKCSPSAESEEFLKIDISIRGGTSYLPSEARRIHTPPLPKDIPNRRRRGFFFDYNAMQDRPGHRLCEQPKIASKHGGVDETATNDNEEAPERSSRNVELLEECRPHHHGQDQQTDWYGLQLAELDLLDDDSGPLLVQAQSRTSTFIMEELKWHEEEKMDYSIPEHLPSSPSCPRHPRY